MKVAVIGGGITGISACLYLSQIKNMDRMDVHLYSDDVGGNFAKGGLKYLKKTIFTERFLEKIVPLNYKVSSVVGALHYKNHIELFPYFMELDNEIGKRIQKEYWYKTGRDVNKFDDRCMNDVWNYRTELKIDFEDGILGFIYKLTNEILSEEHCTCYLSYLTGDKLNEIISEYDLVIYTLPLSFLLKTLGKHIDIKMDNSDLHIYKFKAEKRIRDHVWFDYIYFPHITYPFHRISKTLSGFDVEVNGSKGGVISGVDDFFYNNFGHHINQKVELIRMPGQITTDVPDLEIIPDNVVLLGRFAEWNKRITWDNVVESLFENEKINSHSVY